MNSLHPWTQRAGVIATIGVFFIMIGEYLLLFSAGGGYEAIDYHYFLDISRSRLIMGHFLTILFIPSYYLGYWHVYQAMKPTSKRIRLWVWFLAIYSFSVAAAWISSRVYLGLLVQAQRGAGYETLKVLGTLLQDFSSVSEPLVNVLRVAIVLISILFAVQVGRGKTNYPRWFAIFNPALILGIIFALYAFVPRVGVYLLPAAMNVTHVLFFGLSSWLVWRGSSRVSSRS